MNRKNIILGFAVGFFVLSVLSLFVVVSTQVLTALSLSSLLLAFAQTFENNLTMEDEEQKKKVDALNLANNLNLNNDFLFFLKKYNQELFPTPKFKRYQFITKILECVAIAVLVVGLVIPIKAFEVECISRASTIGSLGFLFLSIWQIESSKEKVQAWDAIQFLGIILQNTNANVEQAKEDNTNGQT